MSSSTMRITLTNRQFLNTWIAKLYEKIYIATIKMNDLYNIKICLNRVLALEYLLQENYDYIMVIYTYWKAKLRTSESINTIKSGGTRSKSLSAIPRRVESS